MISQVFSTSGALAKTIAGFQPRQSQLDMAVAVEQAIKNNQQLVVEAGTGTGKTYAYLVPALLSDKKVIISTGSKNLQEQLFHRDLPLMIKTLDFTGNVALLKGRANYLCPERLSLQFVECHSGQVEASVLNQLVKVRTWASLTKTGDLSECEDLPEDSLVIPTITSTNENCLGKDCPSYSECFVVKARKKAMEADIVVVNHHLFLADLAIKETGFGELIPDADVYIFDEAHQLPDIASHYFGQSISSRQLQEIAKDIHIAYRTELRDTRQLEKVADHLSRAASDMRLALGDAGYRGNWRDMLQRPNIQREMTRLLDTLDLAHDVMKLVLGRSQLLDAAFDRAQIAKSRLVRVQDTSISGYSYWFECTRLHFSLNITPLSVADKFKEQIDDKSGAWVFTSATLAVNDDFSHFTNRLGLTPKSQFTLPSPFDYEKQALLCVPRYLPDLRQVNIAQQLVEMLRPVIEENQGRCFFLCTSHRMVRDLSEAFRACLDLPVLAQGEMSKQKLLAQFMALGNAVLVATSAFWEGIDVRGQALSCVIIDKLPFMAPDDPLLKARIEDCALQGGDPFYQVQIPDAVITLKQGVGRLIRDTNDFGALIICDNRLVNRPYGHIFLRSLPAIPRTRDLKKVSDFLASVNERDKSAVLEMPAPEENHDA